MIGVKYLHCPACGRINRLFSETEEFSKTLQYLCNSCWNRSLIDEWFVPVMKNKWVAQQLGRYPYFETSIVRMNNLHGRLSYGWCGKDKIILGNANEHTIQILKEASVKMANEKNIQENNQ